MKKTLPLILGAALGLSAQTQDQFEVRVPPPGARPSMQTMEFIRSEFGPVGPVVKNAPYTAESATETIQVLSDGNRIVHKSSTPVARDSEGRTRRDLAIVAVGPLAANAPSLSIIYDPVANVSYTLDHTAKTARKMTGNSVVIHDTAPAIAATRMVDVRVAQAGEGVGGNVMFSAIGPMLRTEKPSSGKTESLGKQNIEGVLAEGTRTTDVIPAGEIGNERPIEIVSERWYSPELQTVVMTRHKDPRMGETTYKLTGIRRSEPLKSLFEVPPDYVVKEGGMPPMPAMPGMPAVRQMHPKARE